MEKYVGASWPDANNEWKEKRVENLRRALKHMVDVAFLIFANHALDSKPEQATNDLIEILFGWVLCNRVSMNTLRGKGINCSA